MAAVRWVRCSGNMGWENGLRWAYRGRGLVGDAKVVDVSRRWVRG